ncbi:DUF3099 domain-containing protein [Streptomyces sp. RFCAC02]|uniref:DUF3099 domain-containing protein n=1 Tax=Streptomyces sp. RFCAC02 TaxID=2499143 RepID=UPI0010217183|nr:DUF3099 domain-containing protein [Streptomyces sp. RFCAC02]
MRTRTGKKPAGGGEVYRITGARQGLTDDVRGRQRRYVISMLIRTVAVIATVLLWNVSRPVAVVTLVAGALLPYIAVVVANAGRENVPSLPSALLTSGRSALPPADEHLHNRN